MLFFARLLQFEVDLKPYDTPESNQHFLCILLDSEGRTKMGDGLYALYFSKCPRLGVNDVNMLLYF